jgi:hypothetical protein
MFASNNRRIFRRAIALVAAYALALQTLFSYIGSAQAAAGTDRSAADTIFVICSSSHDGAVADEGTGVPTKPVAHCPLCTLSSAAAGLAPDAVPMPLRDGVSGGPLPFVSTAACLSFHSARAGLSRAPPQTA